ncbi:hypothetical protein [Streptomyces sp. NPDC058371]|uniref:hypothetical protein n=1 Tax=Streptomyces sp. NPDC058371 TaxID=3346463 RepID=UPI003669BF75
MKITYRIAATCVLVLGSFGIGGEALAAPQDTTNGPVSTFCNNPVNLSLVASPGGSGLLGEALGSLGLGGLGLEGTGGSGSSTPSADGTATGGEGGTASTSSDQQANYNRCGKSVDVDKSTTVTND